MDATFFLDTAIRPTLAQMDRLSNGKAVFSGAKAEAMLLAIALQESGLADRIQGPGDRGPARSFFQFERIGVLDVVMRRAEMLKKICEFLVMSPGIDAVWQNMAYHDQLSVAVARLTLHLDKQPLPDANGSSEDEAWLCYLRCWRPGKPHRNRWASNWPAAVRAVQA